jgi:hypothetical protein
MGCRRCVHCWRFTLHSSALIFVLIIGGGQSYAQTPPQPAPLTAQSASEQFQAGIKEAARASE